MLGVFVNNAIEIQLNCKPLLSLITKRLLEASSQCCPYGEPKLITSFRREAVATVLIPFENL